MAKISIIVPVYNPLEQYLRECLDSLIHQTLQDIEIICIDNDSLGGCPAILQEYEEKDARIKLIRCCENQGAAGAVNLGIEQSSAEYFQIVDSDDYLSLDACEKLSAIVVNRAVDLVVFNATNMEARSQERGSRHVKYEYLEVIDPLFLNKLNQTQDILDDLYRCTLQYWNKLYKKSLVLMKAGNVLDMDLKYIFCDVLFCAKQYLYAKTIYILSDVCYHYRANNENGVVAKYNENCSYYNAPFLLCEKLLAFSQSDDCPNGCRKYLYYILMQHLFVTFPVFNGAKRIPFYRQLQMTLRGINEEDLKRYLYNPQLRLWYYIVRSVPCWLFRCLKIKIKQKGTIAKVKILNVTVYTRKIERFF